MRVVHINTYESGGGAAVAAVQLHRALLARGVESDLLVRVRQGGGATRVHDVMEAIATLPQKLSLNLRARAWAWRHERRLRGRPDAGEAFSFPEAAFDLARHPLVRAADVVHLHWVDRFLDHRGFFTRVRKPLVWTLHDRHPFTGGNHCDALFPYAAYRELIERQEGVKARALADLPDDRMVMVGASAAYVAASRRSRLLGRFAHELVHHGIDLAVFRLLPEGTRAALREKWGVAPEAKLALFVGTDTRRLIKGFDLARQAVDAAGIPGLVLGAVGASDLGPAGGLRPFGPVADPRDLAELYNLADVFLSASLEESFGLSLAEALCCGLPVVSSDVGVAPEVVGEGHGYLYPAGDVPALAAALRRWDADRRRFDRSAIAEDARRVFDPALQAQRYLAIYDRLVRGSGRA